MSSASIEQSWCAGYSTSAPTLDNSALYAIDVAFDSGLVDAYVDGVRYVSATIEGWDKETELMFGFSAATGGLWDNHTVDDLSLTMPCLE